MRSTIYGVSTFKLVLGRTRGVTLIANPGIVSDPTNVMHTTVIREKVLRCKRRWPPTNVSFTDKTLIGVRPKLLYAEDPACRRKPVCGGLDWPS